MEKLTEKCDVIRKKSFLEKYVENNTIYVVLGPKDSKADTSIGELVITMLNKIRISAGQTPKYKVPNLVLVQDMPKGVEKIGNFVEWSHKVLAKKTSLKKENLDKHLCSDGITAINPFITVGNGVFINNYGPKQEFMKFEIEKHETQHNAIQRAILHFGSWKFSDFQLLIHAVIFSQFCEQCLFSLLQPLDSLEKAQKLVNTISHGIWCPLDRNSMERVTWKTDSGEIYEPTCWRMDRNAQVQIPSKPSSSSSNRPSEASQKPPPLADWQINSLHSVLDHLQDCSDKLDQVTDYKKQDSVAAEKQKLNTIRMNLDRWLMDLNEFETNPDVVVGKFGFETGDSELDKVLEEKILELFTNGKIEVNMSKILNSIDHKAYKMYLKAGKAKKIENHIMEKIAEKSRSLLEKSQKSKKSEKKRNEEILEPGGRESDGETVGDEESGDDVDDEQDSEAVGDEEEGDSGVDREVREEEQVEHGGYEEERIEDPQSPEPMPRRKRNDRRVIRMVDKVPCPRSDQMSQSDKEYLWEAMKTAYQYMKQLELPLIREHPAHVFCVYCQSFVDDLGPKCFSHDDIEGRVKIDLMGTFNWKTAERVEAEDVRAMTKYLKEQGKYWKTEIENHRDPSPSPSSTPSTSPEPPRKNPKNVRMARRTGVPVVVEQREVVEEPVEMEQREEEVGTRKRKSRAFLESSEEDSTGSEEQETSGNGSKEAERSEDRVATRLRTLRSHQSGATGKFEKRAKRGEESDGDDGVPVKKTTKKTGKSVETAEEWGEDSDGEPQPKRRGRPRKSDLVGKEKTPKKGRTAVEESEQGSEESEESDESEESEEDGIDRVAEDLRRRGITFHNTRQYSPTRIPKTPQPAEPGEYDDFTEYNLVVNRKQLRKAATIGMEIRKIDKKKDSPKELYGSRQYFWRKAQHFEVAQLAPGPSGADISQMDTPSEQETDSDDEEENRRKMKKKRKKSSESASGGKKTKESKKSDTNQEKAVHIVQDDDDDDIQILETPPPPPAPKPKDPIRAPTVNWNYKPGSSSSSMDRPRVDRFPTSPSRDHNYDFANISTFSSRTTLSATGTPSKQDEGSAGKKSLLRRSDPIPKIPPAPVVFNFNPSKTPLKTTKSPAKLTETPVITNPVITVNRHIFQDNEIQVPRHVYPSISISNEVVMEDALDPSPTPTTPAARVDLQEVRGPEVAEIDSGGVINVISGSKKTLGQKTFDWNQHLKNVQHDHAYCSTTLTPIHPPPNHNSLPNTNGFRSIFAEFNLPDKTPGDEAKTFDSSATPASQSILNGSQTSSIKFMDMEEDKPSDSGNTLSLPVPTPSPSSSAHGSRISTESVRKQTSGAEKDKSPAQKASTSDYFEEKCEGGLDNMFPLPPGKTKHDEKCTTM